MKKFSLPLVGLLLSLVLFFSCGADVEKEIVGSWTATSLKVANIDEFKDIMEINNDVELAIVEASMLEDIQGQSFDFKEDKKVIDPSGEEGTWSYDADNKTLIIKSGNEVGYKLKVNNIGGNKLDGVMIFEEDEGTMELAMEFEKK